MRISDFGIMELSGMEFHAYHGCLESERKEGNLFVVDFKARYRLGAAARTDNLEDAADYTRIYEIVAREMAIPSDLLEHVAGRICRVVFSRFPQATGIELKLTKLNPPMGADCEGASVEVMVSNEK